MWGPYGGDEEDYCDLEVTVQHMGKRRYVMVVRPVLTSWKMKWIDDFSWTSWK